MPWSSLGITALRQRPHPRLGLPKARVDVLKEIPETHKQQLRSFLPICCIFLIIFSNVYLLKNGRLFIALIHLYNYTTTPRFNMCIMINTVAQCSPIYLLCRYICNTFYISYYKQVGTELCIIFSFVIFKDSL